MSLPKQVEEAVARLEEASWRIEQARAKRPTVQNLCEWLGALTDFVSALSTIHELDREALQEKLDEIAGRLRLEPRSPKGSHFGGTTDR